MDALRRQGAARQSRDGQGHPAPLGATEAAGSAEETTAAVPAAMARLAAVGATDAPGSCSPQRTERPCFAPAGIPAQVGK